MGIRTTLRAFVFLLALRAQAQTDGVLIVEKETRNGQVTTSQIRIGRNNFRVDGIESGEQKALIFDRVKSIAVDLNLNRKTYVEISKAEMDRLLEEVLRRALTNVAPEQRQQAEQTVRARMAANATGPPLRDYVPLNKDRVGEWECTNYADDRSVLCGADPSAFGLTSADFEILRKFETFVLGLAPVSVSRPNIAPIIAGTRDGKPFFALALRRVRDTYPASRIVNEITVVQREKLAPDLFDIPEGFRKETGIPVPPAEPRD